MFSAYFFYLFLHHFNTKISVYMQVFNIARRQDFLNLVHETISTRH